MKGDNMNMTQKAIDEKTLDAARQIMDAAEEKLLELGVEFLLFTDTGNGIRVSRLSRLGAIGLAQSYLTMATAHACFPAGYEAVMKAGEKIKPEAENETRGGAGDGSARRVECHNGRRGMTEEEKTLIKHEYETAKMIKEIANLREIADEQVKDSNHWRREYDTLLSENERLRRVAEAAKRTFDELYEINLNNYNHNEVEKQNTSVVFALMTIKAALDALEAT